MANNRVIGNRLYLKKIPKYASNIVDAGSGLPGDLCVPAESLEFWNCTKKPVEIHNKNCLELDSQNVYCFQRKNLIDYMNSVHLEYISNALQIYEEYPRDVDKRVDENGWRTRMNRINTDDQSLYFNLFLKPTRDSDAKKKTRYYIFSTAENNSIYHYVIAYCIIPEHTNIMIQKDFLADGKCQFTFCLESVNLDNSITLLEKEYRKKEEDSLKKSVPELFVIASQKRKEVSSKVATAKVFNRDINVAAYVKKRANGICDLCGEKAPFCDKKKNPYLEEHHVQRLADGGADSIDNTVALCPNCHRMVHVIGTSEMTRKMRQRIRAYMEAEKKMYALNSDVEKHTKK